MTRPGRGVLTTQDDGALERLLAEIRAELRMTRYATGVERLSPDVEAALRAVPRPEFVPPDERGAAFANMPLPIGEGQTISQPFIVALMTELLRLSADDVVLEVGTGSGYQAAILACLAARVYSVERIGDLADTAAARLARLGYSNVQVRRADGYLGWSDHAPFDAIVVTAAAPSVPSELIAQLKPGGRMVIPVGGPWQVQSLQLVTKSAKGDVSVRDVLDVAFVPMVEGVDGGREGHSA